MEAPLDYGNWIRRRRLLILGLCTLGVAALFFIPLGSLYRVAVTVLFALLFTSFLFPLYAYLMFSQNGGKLQDKVYNVLIQRLGATVKGQVLDIGSGNGVLAVKLAQRMSDVEVVGVDSWGKDWEYSKEVCEKNARAATVDDRVHFRKGDAAALDFAPDTFDGAISNLTFHEVQSVADKRTLVREALRIVKPGGTFAFIDYFYDAKYYGNASDFENYLQGLHLAQCKCRPLRDEMDIPLLLRHPRVLGKVGMIYGRK